MATAARSSLTFRLRIFLNFLEDQGCDLPQLDREVCYAYQRFLQEKRKADGEPIKRLTVKAYLAEARRFCVFLVSRNLILVNPFEYVPRLKGERPIPKGLMKEHEAASFLDEMARFSEDGKSLMRTSYDFRHHVLAEVQFSTGLRIGDLAVVRDVDVDWDRGVISIRGGKGGKEGVGYLSSYALSLLELWREVRELILKKGSNLDLLFGATSIGLEKAYNERLNEVAQKVGRGRWHSHLFRHEFGYLMLRAGCSIKYIQQFLNHKKIRTTEIYTKVDVQDVRKVLDTFHPLGQP